MRDFSTPTFLSLLSELKEDNDSILESKINGDEFIKLKYFLTGNSYYSVIIDDYLFEISDKTSLLEALYYQMQLVTVHDLNWDAIEEGIVDFLKSVNDFEGVCILFKKESIKSTLLNEFNVLSEIIKDLNNRENKKVKIIFGE
jgi:hypothetical protein